jgi:hypothetical protein
LRRTRTEPLAKGIVLAKKNPAPSPTLIWGLTVDSGGAPSAATARHGSEQSSLAFAWRAALSRRQTVRAL